MLALLVEVESEGFIDFLVHLCTSQVLMNLFLSMVIFSFYCHHVNHESEVEIYHYELRTQLLSVCE